MACDWTIGKQTKKKKNQCNKNSFFFFLIIMTNNTALLLAESSIWTRNQDKASPEDKTSKKTLFRFSFFHFSRATSQRKEHCVLFADTNTKDEQKELFQLLDASQQCTMVCFLRASQPSSGRWNPLHGNWISVAKTPERCREHVMDGKLAI